MGSAADVDDQCVDARHLVDARSLMSSNSLSNLIYKCLSKHSSSFILLFDRVF